MEIAEEQVVVLDYGSPSLPKAVRQFKPVLFEEDDHFCCILGPDMETAVIGRGPTEDEALHNWVIDFRQRLESTNPNDSLAQYLKDTLSASKYDIN